ncbi:hypothetical protein [Ruegeria conchae]|uniref:Uncharacterized protein n=1 Tax=Ruegeria conchae TaxID=981384 RepID=A0A497ZMY5_9RHOB|nr:hypothetical protein [Ruegeria conchae]RLK07174.1 hypothetical protein CLV75_2281 [Ruegeria conchae]
MKRDDGNSKALIKTLGYLKIVQADVIIPSVAAGRCQISELAKNEQHTAIFDGQNNSDQNDHSRKCDNNCRTDKLSSSKV